LHTHQNGGKRKKNSEKTDIHESKEEDSST